MKKTIRLCALLLFAASLVLMLGACNENAGGAGNGGELEDDGDEVIECFHKAYYDGMLICEKCGDVLYPAVGRTYTEEEVIEYINQGAVGEPIQNYTIVSSRKLYHAPDEESKFTLYNLAPIGYAIIFNDTLNISHMSYRESFIDLPEDEMIYYFNPVCVAVCRDGQFINLYGERPINTADVPNLQENMRNYINNCLYEEARYQYRKAGGKLDTHMLTPHIDHNNNKKCDLCDNTVE